MGAFLRVSALAGVLAAMAEPPAARLVLRQALSHVDAGEPVASMTRDSQLIAFVSMAPLVASDRHAGADIYVLDRRTRRLTLETVTPEGGASNGGAAHPALSADGRYLSFESVATNLTARADRNDASDVFVRDRLTGTTRQLSVGLGGQDANGPSGPPVISDDGAFVAFPSSATNLVRDEDSNGARSDVFLASTATGEIVRVGVDGSGRQFEVSRSPAIDGSGRLVAFVAGPARRTRAPDQRQQPEVAIYLRDVSLESTTCLTCDRRGTPSGPATFSPQLSADGRMLAFAVQTEPDRSDIAVLDRTSGLVAVITRHANARSAAPRMSGDGRVVAFVSWASNLPCGPHCAQDRADENLLPDVYVFDVPTERFSRISGSASEWWTASVAPALGGGGTPVAFSSRQPFGPEDTTIDFDLFVCAPSCP